MRKVGSILVVLLGVVALFSSGCTSQQRAFSYGGTATINLPSGEKLVSITWKSSHLWCLTRPMRPNETAEVYSFQESSSFGVLNGKVIIKEAVINESKRK